MPQFYVGDDVVAAIWKLANPKPFENLSFDTALRRVIAGFAQVVERPLEHSNNSPEEPIAYVAPRRAPTPSAKQWAASIQELKSVPNLTSWKSICDHLEIKTAGDSARRKLQKWIENNKPLWPRVPDTG
ncbi:DUF4248 domain-containing protein [Nitrosospira multiformis]|uniref:DUF4248 domain-containing protein n=1 Tax=Nitrosospira multiformis TaxID=1231 RepID=UPI0011B2544C|nr:DUF4248 domain-containing protein [Nitrosospira multiformis]